MNQKVLSIILILIIIILVGVAGYVVLLRIPTRSGVPDFRIENQTEIKQVIVKNYSKLDFFETLIAYHKVIDSEEKKKIVKILETKADALFETKNKSDIVIAFSLIPQTKDPLFYDYIASHLLKFKDDPGTVADLMGKLAILGDKRAISVIAQHRDDAFKSDIHGSSIVVPVSADAARMRLGDESVLENLLKYSRDDNGNIKTKALMGLGYSFSKEATDRLNEVIAKKEIWSSDAMLALEQQKINSMSLKERGNYLISLNSKYDQGNSNSYWYYDHLGELPFDSDLQPQLITLIKERFDYLRYGPEISKHRQQEYFLRQFINSDNLRPWVEKKLIELKQLP